jgi:hypothetical protein
MILINLTKILNKIQEIKMHQIIKRTIQIISIMNINMKNPKIKKKFKINV